MQHWFIFLCEFSLICYAMISGFFLTFSDFLMRSLDKAAPSAGICVMQHINREIFRSITIVMLWGMAAVSVFVGAYAFVLLSGYQAYFLIAGSASYLTGVLFISYFRNIPMNNKLDSLPCSNAAAVSYWQETYLPRWSFWNSVRALASGASAIFFLLAITGTW